jgi:hypothetical protein
MSLNFSPFRNYLRSAFVGGASHHSPNGHSSAPRGNENKHECATGHNNICPPSNEHISGAVEDYVLLRMW